VAMLIHDYSQFLLHATELQVTIRTYLFFTITSDFIFGSLL